MLGELWCDLHGKSCSQICECKINHRESGMRNNLLGLSIVALVEAALFTALAIANNNAVSGLMAGVVIAEVVNIIISRNEED